MTSVAFMAVELSTWRLCQPKVCGYLCHGGISCAFYGWCLLNVSANSHILQCRIHYAKHMLQHYAFVILAMRPWHFSVLCQNSSRFLSSKKELSARRNMVERSRKKKECTHGLVPSLRNSASHLYHLTWPRHTRSDHQFNHSAWLKEVRPELRPHSRSDFLPIRFQAPSPYYWRQWRK